MNQYNPSEQEVLRQLGFSAASDPPRPMRQYILVHCFSKTSGSIPNHWWLDVEYDRDDKDMYSRDVNANKCFLPPPWT